MANEGGSAPPKDAKSSRDWSRVALLTVWNPRVHPRTIETHVQALKAAPVDRPWTWWGRVYKGGQAPEDLYRDKWTWLPELEGELGRRELLLYVTSFDSLHVLRVDRIARSRPDRGDAVPSYYDDANVVLWFRVRDIKALQWSSFTVADALDSLSPVESVPGAASSFRVDLFAARQNYWPIAVEIIDAERIGGFDGKDVGPSYLADEVSAPADLTAARSALCERAPELWAALDDRVADSLAAARLLWKNPRLGALDASSAALAMARALELLAVPIALRQREVLLALGRRSEIDARVHADHRAWKGEPHLLPMLGQLGHALPELQTLLRASGVEWPSIDGSIEAIRVFAPHRNDAAHGRPVDRAAVESLRSALWPGLVAELVNAARACVCTRSASRPDWLGAGLA